MEEEISRQVIGHVHAGSTLTLETLLEAKRLLEEGSHPEPLLYNFPMTHERMTATEVLAREEWYWAHGPGSRMRNPVEEWVENCRSVIADSLGVSRDWFTLKVRGCQCKRCNR